MKKVSKNIESFLEKHSQSFLLSGSVLCAVIVIGKWEGTVFSYLFLISLLLVFFGSFQKYRLRYFLILASIPLVLSSNIYWQGVSYLDDFFHYIIIIPTYTVLLLGVSKALYPKHINIIVRVVSALIIFLIIWNVMS